MKYCTECGHTLIMKPCGDEGDIPFCEACQLFRFPTFGVSVLVVVFNPSKTHVCLLKQNYVHKNHMVLIAGYVQKGETLEQTVAREVLEETGLKVQKMHFTVSYYHEKSQALMAGFGAVSSHEDITLTSSEVDGANWVEIQQALTELRPDSTGQKHLKHILDGQDYLTW